VSRNYHDVLGIRPNAGRDEIELAYKGRRSQYHPDRYAQADQETQAWATACMQEVNAAYEALINGRPAPAPEEAGSGQGVSQPRAPTPMTLAQALRAHPISKAAMARVYIAPHIPLKKLHNALESYGQGLKPSDVLVLLDDTMFSSGKDGLLLTERQLRVKEAFNPPETFELKGITVALKDGVLYVNRRRARDFNITERGEVHDFVRALNEILKDRAPVPQPLRADPSAASSSTPEGAPGFWLEPLFLQISQQLERERQKADPAMPAGRKLAYMLKLMQAMLAMTGQLQVVAEAVRGNHLQPNEAKWCRTDVVRLELLLYQTAWLSHALRNRYGLSDDKADEELALIGMLLLAPAVAAEAGHRIEDEAAMEALMESAVMAVAKQRMQDYFDRMEDQDQPSCLLEGLCSPVSFAVNGPDDRHREQWASFAKTVCSSNATDRLLRDMQSTLQKGLNERFGS